MPNQPKKCCQFEGEGHSRGCEFFTEPVNPEVKSKCCGADKKIVSRKPQGCDFRIDAYCQKCGKPFIPATESKGEKKHYCKCGYNKEDQHAEDCPKFIPNNESIGWSEERIMEMFRRFAHKTNGVLEGVAWSTFYQAIKETSQDAIKEERERNFKIFTDFITLKPEHKEQLRKIINLNEEE